jgi:hypothetical protein
LEQAQTIKERALYKIFQIPLDLSVQTVLRATPLIRDRQRLGHIHYFTKETALQLLIDLGYNIIDCFYTAVALDLDAGSIPLPLAFRSTRSN